MTLRSRLILGYTALVILLVATGAITLYSANRILPLLLLALCILINGLFIIFIALGILPPLRALTDSTRQVEAGDFTSDLNPSGPAEIATLIRSFNTMAAALLAARRDDAAALLRTREATRTAINSLPDAIAILSPEGRIELANDPAERLFGMKPGAAVSDLPHKWVHQLVNTAVETKTPVAHKGFDTAVQIFDKFHELFFLPHAIPLLNAEQQLVGTTVVLVDATALRQIDEAKSGLIASVSHELKTPLTSIQMAIHLLLEDASSRLTPREVELLQVARDDADRLHELIGNLLDAGRRQQPE